MSAAARAIALSLALASGGTLCLQFGSFERSRCDSPRRPTPGRTGGGKP